MNFQINRELQQSVYSDSQLPFYFYCYEEFTICLLQSMWESREDQLQRSSFMDILVDLRAILISASFASPSKFTRLN